MRFVKYMTIAFATLITAGIKLVAQPDLSSKETVQSLTIFKDIAEPDLFYYAPGDLRIAEDSEGKPEFQFIMMRYTGTKLSGDSQTKRFRNIIRLKIIQKQPSQQILKSVKQLLKKKKRQIRLKPVPVRHIKAVPVYAVPDESTTTESYQALEGSCFTESGSEGQKGSYWSERALTVRLDNYGAQAFKKALTNQQTILSVGYAFYAEVAEADYSKVTLSGAKELVEKLKSVLPDDISSDSAKSKVSVIKSGSFSITLDLNKFPDLIKTLDINEQIPPEYAALNIYCFDFNNNIRSDLYSKRIEIEAVSVSGDIVSEKYTFKRSKPDIYVREFRFPYAVRIDKPYRYRIVEINNVGEFKKSKWKERNTWHEILDITTDQNQTVTAK